METSVHEILETINTKLLKHKSSESCHEICLDTRARKPVIKKYQAKAYCDLAKLKLNRKCTITSVKFGGGIFESSAQIPVRIPAPIEGFIAVKIHVVDASIPFLIRPRILDRYKLVAGNVDICFVSKTEGRKLPILLKHRHTYVEWNILGSTVYEVSVETSPPVFLPSIHSKASEPD